jgi:GDP-mannose pyrophosphatase NudK
LKANILEKKILSHKWGQYAEYTLDYQRSDGRNEIQTREMQDNGHGAAVLLYNTDKSEIILIKQFRLAAMLDDQADGVILEVCAGLIEDGNAETTIKKEILEEVGLQISHVEFIFKGFASPGAKTEMIHFFIAAYDDHTPKQQGGGLLEEQEDIEIVYMDFDKAYDMVYTQEIIDQKTITLLLYAKLNIFKN